MMMEQNIDALTHSQTHTHTHQNTETKIMFVRFLFHCAKIKNRKKSFHTHTRYKNSEQTNKMPVREGGGGWFQNLINCKRITNFYSFFF